MNLDHEEKSTGGIGSIGITHGSLRTGEGFESITLVNTKSICQACVLPIE